MSTGSSSTWTDRLRAPGPFSLDGPHVRAADGTVVCTVVSGNPADEVFALAAMNAHHRARPALMKRQPGDATKE
jgi:hypothetical protein